MSLLSPLWLVAAALVGAAVIVAHLFSTAVPPKSVLPTVRFVPDESAPAVSRSRRVSDLLLLALRLLAVAALGFAFAGAYLPRGAPSRVVVVDVSRAVGSVAELRDSVRALSPELAIVFDSTARRLTGDSLVLLRARGSLSSGLVAAHRGLAHATKGRDRTELVVVSPLVREEMDSATATLLALWEGPVRLVRVRPGVSQRPLSWEIRTVGDDAVEAALASFQIWNEGCTARITTRARTCVPAVRVVRTTPTDSDSLWARDSAGVLVLWPFTATATPDSQYGIATATETVIAPFQQLSRPANGRVLIRWPNGEPAATERALGRGCIRDVAVAVDPVGDVALRESFRNVAGSLVEPCGGAGDFTLAPIPRVQKTFTRLEASAAAGTLPLWLVLFAATILLVEQRLRR